MWFFPKHLVVVECSLYLLFAYILVFLIHPKSKIKWFYPFAILLLIEVSFMIYGQHFMEVDMIFSRSITVVYTSLVIACIQWPIALISAIYFRVKHIKEMDAIRLEEIKKRKQQKRTKPNKR